MLHMATHMLLMEECTVLHMAAVMATEDMAGMQGMAVTNTDNMAQHTANNMLRMQLIKRVHMLRFKQLPSNLTIEAMLWPLRQAILPK